jgi:pantetheine-phosphate adenylyltransferase
VSLVERGLTIFNRLIVAVAQNPLKRTLFTVAERLELLRESLKDFPADRLEIESYDGLTVEYARDKGAAAILRGLRATADFDYEFQMALMNRHVNHDIQSVFLMADYQWFFISSSVVKEAASLGADMSALVPPPVALKLQRKLQNAKRKPRPL